MLISDANIRVALSGKVKTALTDYKDFIDLAQVFC
jgi:hypothetical protein